MKLKKVTAGLLVFLFVMLSATGCSQPSQDSQSSNSVAPAVAATEDAVTTTTEPEPVASGAPAELLFYHHMSEMTEYFTQWCEEFSARHPDIKIEQETQRDSSTLQVKYAAGDDPEMVLGVQTQQYYDQGKYIDLSGQTELLSRIDQDLIPIITDPKSGKIYRIPMGMNALGIFYNKAMFDELGLTEAHNWDEFLHNARTIRDKKPGVIPIHFQRDNYGHQVQYIPLALKMLDVGVAEIQKAAAYNDSSVLQFVDNNYLTMYAETINMMKEEKLFDAEIAITGNTAMSYEAFATGKTAMVINGTWWYGGIKAQFPDVDDYIQFATIPAIDGRGEYSSKGQDSAISISASSPYQEQLAIVMDEFFDPEQVKAWSEKRGSPASMPEVHSVWGSQHIVDKIYSIMNDDSIPKMSEIVLPSGLGRDIIGKMVEEVIVGTLAPEDFAQKFQDQWDACFQ